MPYFSAYGCCRVCRRVVSCRARTVEEAVGSRPYRHKAERGPGLPWCPGAALPALHYTESREQDFVEEVQRLKRELRG